jgi:uncharacterized protein
MVSQKGPVTIVTGASSSIGYELAKQFGQHWPRVTAEDDGIAKAVYDTNHSTGRRLDAIAINAGVGPGGDFARHTRLEGELNLNSVSVTSCHLAKYVVQDIVARKKGRILSFSETLRNELEDSGVTVTALMPDATETNFLRRAGMQDTKAGAANVLRALREDARNPPFKGRP